MRLKCLLRRIKDSTLISALHTVAFRAIKSIGHGPLLHLAENFEILFSSIVSRQIVKLSIALSFR